MSSIPSVTVAILQFNSAQLTLDLLASIGRCDPESVHAFTFVVMDNGSEVPRLDEIQSTYPWVRTVPYGKNLGFARAHNALMPSVRTKWLFLVNNDCVLQNDALTSTVAAAERTNADFATCAVFNPDGSHQVNWGILPTPLRRIFFNGTGLAGLRRLFVLRSNLASVGYINGAVLLLRLASLSPGPLFDESQFMYGEDLDLMFRLARNGAKGIRAAHGKITHIGGASASKRWSNQEVLELKRAIEIECMRRHFPAWQVAVFGAIRRQSAPAKSR